MTATHASTWRTRLATADGTRSTGLIRAAPGVLVLGAIAILASRGFGFIVPYWPVAVTAWTVLALLAASDMPARFGPTPARRYLAVLLDVGGVSSLLHVLGAAGAFLPFAYLWITVHNGLRNGDRSLLVAAATSLGGFSPAAVTTPFWRAEPSLTAGLIVGFAALSVSLYPLVKQLTAARLLAERTSLATTQLLNGADLMFHMPLTRISGSVECLPATRLNAKQTALVAKINAQADELVAAMAGLFHDSRVELPSSGPEITPSDRE
jgi:two-component system sensor histidine kinase RpfC